MAQIGIRFVDVSLRHAIIAAAARDEHPLNLGDCFVYALALVTDGTILTLDADFKNCGLPVIRLT